MTKKSTWLMVFAKKVQDYFITHNTYSFNAIKNKKMFSTVKIQNGGLKKW
jgi:hypothetical protein